MIIYIVMQKVCARKVRKTLTDEMNENESPKLLSVNYVYITVIRRTFISDQ